MTTNPVDVLIVLPTAILGGAERVMFNLAAHLLDEGNKVTVYAMSRGPQLGWAILQKQAKFKMIACNFDSEKTSLLPFIINIFKISRLNNYDYVISTHTHVNAALSFLKRIKLLKCSKLIGRESTFIFDRFYGTKRRFFFILYKILYGSHDVLICQTENMKISLVKNLGFIPAKKIVTIANPVNLVHINRLLEDPEDSLPRMPSNYKIIVACGRLIKLKGFHVLIEAFSFVVENNPMTRLIIIGDGPERSNLEYLAKEFKVFNKISFLGRLENPIIWFSIADIGIISSEREGFPNVLIEMMASGAKYIISTPCSDGVFDIPGIKVLDKYSASSIADALHSSLVEPEDRSASYKLYIQNNRVVGAFWKEICGLTKNENT